MKHIIKLAVLIFILSACAPSTLEIVFNPDTYEYQDFAYEIVWSKDETMVALTTLTGLYIYDTKTFEQIFAFNQNGGSQIVFGKKYLVTTNHTGVFVWNLENFELLFQIPTKDDLQFPSLAISPNDEILVTSYPKETIMWELPNGTKLSTIPIESLASDIKFKSDNQLIIASAFYGTIQEWDISKEKKNREFDFGKTVITLKLSNDANFVIVDYGFTGFELWDVSKEKIKHGYGDIVSAEGWQRLSGNNQFVTVWGYAFDGQNSALSVWDLEAHVKTQEFTTPFFNGDGWRCGSLNRDGTILIASNSEGHIYFYDLITGEKIGDIFLPYKFVVEKG